MYLSEAEKQRRYELVRAEMQKQGLDVIIALGDRCIGGARGTGSFRYLTDFFIIFNWGLVLFFPEGDPVMLVTSELQRFWALKHSWINDVRFSMNYVPDVIAIVKERTQGKSGRVGFAGFESMPHSLSQSFREELPGVELRDAEPMLLTLRFTKSKEEHDLMRKAARLTDGGFEAVVQMITPGVKEYEIIGALDGYHRGHGSDQTFNLISSGPFPRSTDGTDFPALPWYPSDRTIQRGDVVLLEMTTVYGGYWNQLVRAVSVGGANNALVSFKDAVVKTTEAGISAMRPGVAIDDVVGSMAKAAEAQGFELTLPMGHIVGLDLVEARVSPGSSLVLNDGTTAIIHPCLRDKSGARMLWGQTYVVTDAGTTPFNSMGHDVLVVG